MFTRNILARKIPNVESIFRGSNLRMASFTPDSASLEMDRIRARSLLKHTYVYDPPSDIENTIEAMARQHKFELNSNDWKATEIDDLNKKEKLLLDLGSELKHFVPNSELHKLNTLEDLLAFYQKPVKNITKYAEMARNDELPRNLSIQEHPVRFHPNDKTALHGGVTAYPGDGGKVLGIRNQRLYRQFKPKKDWFDYEDRSFSHDVTLSKGMPWDPEVARKMDSHPNVRFTNDHLKKIK